MANDLLAKPGNPVAPTAATKSAKRAGRGPALGRGPARSVVTRSRFANSFVRAMASDFEQYGVSAIKRVRSRYPAIYLKICTMMLPKEIQVKEDAISRLSDEQLDEIASRTTPQP